MHIKKINKSKDKLLEIRVISAKNGRYRGKYRMEFHAKTLVCGVSLSSTGTVALYTKETKPLVTRKISFLECTDESKNVPQNIRELAVHHANAVFLPIQARSVWPVA